MSNKLKKNYTFTFSFLTVELSQTGSGKTYSMGTGLENTNDPENEGPLDFFSALLHKIK